MPPSPAAPATAAAARGRVALWVGVLLGLALLAAAWMVPVHLRSVAPALLARAAADTPSLADLAEARLDSAQPGAAALLLEGARAAGAPSSELLGLETALQTFAQREPVLAVWGGEDPFLLPLTRQPAARAAAQRGESTPVLRFFVTADARGALRGFLANSRVAAVRDTLALAGLKDTGQFVPAGLAGGQTYEALVLLAALLQQGEHLSPAFARVWRDEARLALAQGALGERMETLLIDLLALGRRLDWRQLTTLAGGVETREAWADLGRLARAGGEPFTLAAAAALADGARTGSTERVIAYRRLHVGGEEAADQDLRLALLEGQGALRLLLDRGVPVNRQPAPAPGALVELALLHGGWALALRYALCAAGAYLILLGIDRGLRAAAPAPAAGAATASGGVFHARCGVLALVATGAFLVVTEPNLGRTAPRIEGVTLAMPVLGNLADPDSLRSVTPTFAMDLHSLLAIALFGALQVTMYMVCLAKIRSIDALPLPPLVKLRLMENEENLFDGGLYLGIGGTAAALVFQVLGLVEPNLLAAYSSNLLGITCVALVKIRHVRPYKTNLILSAQDLVAAGDPSVPRAASTR
jgi:hypothetical protein